MNNFKRVEGLYLDGDNYIEETVTGISGEKLKEPACCEEGQCGTKICDCKKGPSLINGISGSVKDALNIIER